MQLEQLRLELAGGDLLVVESERGHVLQVSSLDVPVSLSCAPWPLRRVLGARHRRHRPCRRRDRGAARGRGVPRARRGPRRTAISRGRTRRGRSSSARPPSWAGSTSSCTRRARASRPGELADVTEADWDAAHGATAKGAFFVAQAAAPHLRESKGVLVLIEDVAAYEPWPLFAPHCAAKAAEAMLTRVLARALAPDVRVCGVAPGTVAVEPGQEERRAAESLLGRDRHARRRRRRRALPHARELRHRHEHRRGRRPAARAPQRNARNPPAP